MARQLTPFSNRLWKFNGFVIAAAGLIGIAVGIVALYSIGTNLFGHRVVGNLVSAPHDADANSSGATLPKLSLEINRFEAIAGTDILWSSVTSREDRRLRYYSKTASGIRNYIFYNTATGAQHRLLSTNLGLVTNVWKLRQTFEPQILHRLSEGGTATIAAPHALMFVLIDGDSDGDGLLSHKDAKTLLLSRTDGTGATPVVLSFKTVLGLRLVSDKELVVMVSTPSGGKAVHISLEDFKVLRQVDIAN